MASKESLQPMSSICSGSKPFRPVEHLAVYRRWNIPANKYGDSAGEWSCVSIILIFLILQLLYESKLCFLQLSLVRSTFWLALFGFEIFRSVQIWVISVFYALFPYSIQQYLPWSSLFLTWFLVLLLFWVISGNRTCSVGKERCHYLTLVSQKRCHRLNLVSKERFYLKTACQQLHLHGAR